MFGIDLIVLIPIVVVIWLLIWGVWLYTFSRIGAMKGEALKGSPYMGTYHIWAAWGIAWPIIVVLALPGAIVFGIGRYLFSMYDRGHQDGELIVNRKKELIEDVRI